MTRGLDTSFLVAAGVAGHADHAAARTLAASLLMPNPADFTVFPKLSTSY